MQHITKNCLYSLEVELTNCDGTPVDLSTSTVKYILKRNKSDDDAIALLSYEYVNPTTNNLLFEFDATQTADLEEGNAICAIKIYRANDKNEEIWYDECVIESGVFNENVVEEEI